VQEVGNAADKCRVGTKRKLETLQDENACLLADAQKKIAKLRKQGNKLPGLMKMLQAFG
jgi:hypothetical protein